MPNKANPNVKVKTYMYIAEVRCLFKNGTKWARKSLEATDSVKPCSIILAVTMHISPKVLLDGAPKTKIVGGNPLRKVDVNLYLLLFF